MKLIKEKNELGLTNKDFVEYLQTPIQKTEITASEIDELRKTLEDGLSKFGGLAISATQLGIKKRACFIKFGDEESGKELLLINPVITERSKDAFLFYEGSVSIPSTLKESIRTIRSCKVVVQSDNMGEMVFEINTEGDKDQVSVETMMNVIVQHAIDQLDGITIKDRKYNTTITNKVNYGRNDKVVMRSPDGDLVDIKYKKANDYFLKGYEIV